MARLPTVATLFDSGNYVFSKEWKHLTSIVVLLALPLYLISVGFESNPALFIPYLLLSLIIGPLLSIFTTAITYYRYDKDKTIHSKELYQFVHKKFFPVLGTTILITILVGLAMLLLLIPGAILGIIYAITKPVLFVGTFANGALTSTGLAYGAIMILSSIIISVGASVYMMFALPITILTKKTGLRAINESIKLVKGRWWNIFGRFLLLEILAFIFIKIVGLIGATIVGKGALGLLVISLLQQVAIIPITLALIIFYLDIRNNPRARDKAPKEEVKSKQVTVRKTTKKKTSTTKTRSKKSTDIKKRKKTSKKITKRKVAKKK